MWRQSVRPICACGHSASFDPHGLWWHFERRGWDDYFEAARKRFWCIVCLSAHRRRYRPVKIELVKQSDRDIVLPLPSELEWKRLLRRVR